MPQTILAVIVTVMLLGNMSEPMLPPLRIVSPVDGTTVRNPLTVVLETPADLSAMTMSTHMTEHSPPHLHISLDTRVTMPALKHLTKVAERRYRYVFGTVAPGRHTIRVYWADAKTHKAMNLPRTVTVDVR